MRRFCAEVSLIETTNSLPTARYVVLLSPQGDKHRQISDKLRDIQNKKKHQKTDLDLTNQRIETCQQDINKLQKELEVCV